MAEREDIHRKKEAFERKVEKLKSQDLSGDNKKHILNFLDYLLTKEELSFARVCFYLHKLEKISKWLRKDFKKADEGDIEGLMKKIKRESWKEWTKTGYKITIKKFYQWLQGDPRKGEYPEKVKWIKTRNNRNSNNLDPQSLLTPHDIEKMVKVANNPRDKALISVLFESGCRIGEFLNLKIKHVSFQKQGAKIIVNGKTGVRRLLLIFSVRYLSNWLENHPNKENPEAYVWVSMATNYKPKRMRYNSVRKKLRKLGGKVGILKPVNPHFFRKSSATYKAASGLNEAQLCQYFGWIQGSKVVSKYVALSGRDVDSAIKEMYGIEEKKKNNKVECQRCRKDNLANASFCQKCGLPLHIGAALEMENKHRKFQDKIKPIMELLEDEEVKEFLAERLAKK